MFEWYRQLGGVGRSTFWACFAGYALDALDVQVYSFVIPTMIGLSLLTRDQAGVVATSTLVFSAFGGWLAGMLADRVGRVRTLQITVLWFAVFTAACGLTHGFTQLLVCRSLQGLGFGGEWAAGSVLMGEVIAARYRGRAVGFVQSSWSVGWAAAAIMATLILHLLAPQIAWRAMFLVGILPALGTFVIRRFVPEPAAFVRAHDAAPAPNTLAIFGRDLWWTTLRGSVLSLGAQGGYYSITTWLPTFLRNERHITVTQSLPYLLVVTGGSFVGYVVSAYLTDGIGRRLNFVLFAVGSAVTVIVYTRLPVSDGVMFVLGFPLGFFSSGVFSGMGALFTELYPTELRGAGQGFCYNAGRGFAAFFPSLVGGAASGLPLGEAIGLFAALAYGLMVLAALTLPETRGQALTSYATMSRGAAGGMK